MRKDCVSEKAFYSFQTTSIIKAEIDRKLETISVAGRSLPQQGN
jgi:hypothetical protein